MSVARARELALQWRAGALRAEEERELQALLLDGGVLAGDGSRLALLEEMLATALRDVNVRTWAILDGQRLMSHAEAGFYVALDVFAQWKAVALPKNHGEKPLDMPRAEEGVGS